MKGKNMKPTAIHQITGSKTKEKVPTSFLEREEMDYQEGLLLIENSKKESVKKFALVMGMFALAFCALLSVIVVLQIYKKDFIHGSVGQVEKMVNQ